MVIPKQMLVAVAFEVGGIYLKRVLEINPDTTG